MYRERAPSLFYNFLALFLAICILALIGPLIPEEDWFVIIPFVLATQNERPISRSSGMYFLEQVFEYTQII